MTGLAIPQWFVSDHPRSEPASRPSLRRLEIRMLGSFQVRRRDGSIVEPTEWRTGKAADLLRLLALRCGDAIPALTLVAALWPRSDQRRGQVSLRTAASEVRKVIGPEFLERSLAGLRLRDVWVDVTAFRNMSARAHELAITGDVSAVHPIAREADRLFRGDFTAHNDEAEWAQSERRALSNTYQVLLCEASESAAALGLGHEAVDFAQRAAALDPFSERASRMLMHAHADVGELSLALREHERCRSVLSEQLGIEPSPQTRKLHRLLLHSVQSAADAGTSEMNPPDHRVERHRPVLLRGDGALPCCRIADDLTDRALTVALQGVE